MIGISCSYDGRIHTAVIYRKNDAEDWNLLCHLDPTVLEIQDTEEYVKETMDNPNN